MLQFYSILGYSVRVKCNKHKFFVHSFYVYSFPQVSAQTREISELKQRIDDSDRERLESFERAEICFQVKKLAMGLFSDLERDEQKYASDIEVCDTLLKCPIASSIFREAETRSQGDAACSASSNADELFTSDSFLYIFNEMKFGQNEAHIDDKRNLVTLKELRELTGSSTDESKMLYLLEFLIDVAVREGCSKSLNDYPLTKLNSVPRYKRSD